MIAFAEMLIPAANKAGMSVPSAVPEELDEIKETHTHFWTFCVLQLARPMTAPAEHWENAKVIAAIPMKRLRTMTMEDFTKAGVVGLPV